MFVFYTNLDTIMISTFYPRPIAFLALCAVFLVTGCSSEEPGAPAIHTPKPGSGFTYTSYTTDSNGRRIDATTQTVLRTILANGVTVAGRQNVVQYLEDGDTISIHYEANGDASYYQAAVTYPNSDLPAMPGLDIPEITVPARWVTFAFGSKTTTAIPSYDSTINIPFNGFPIPVRVQVTGTTSYIAAEDLSINGETIATQKGLLLLNASFIVPLMGNSTVNKIDTFWFAPKLGMFVRNDGSAHGNFPEQFGGAQKMNGNFSTLVGYSLK